MGLGEQRWETKGPLSPPVFLLIKRQLGAELAPKQMPPPPGHLGRDGPIQKGEEGSWQLILSQPKEAGPFGVFTVEALASSGRHRIWWPCRESSDLQGSAGQSRCQLEGARKA